VVLPAWQDCYENAARAEWLQVGLHANKTSAPNISESELTKAITAILESDTFHQNARKLSRSVSASSGRARAADLIVDIASGRLRAQEAMVQDAVDSVCSNQVSEVREIRNENGKVLLSISTKDIWRFP
jgi:2-acylglycerol O-acyltransferase 1